MAVLESSKIGRVVHPGQKNYVWRRPCRAPIDQIGTPLGLDKACPRECVVRAFATRLTTMRVKPLISRAIARSAATRGWAAFK